MYVGRWQTWNLKCVWAAELEMLLSHTGKRHGARCGDWKQSGGSGDRSMLLCHMEAKGPSGILG